MFSFISLSLILASSTLHVAGHGVVKSLSINGVSYPGINYNGQGPDNTPVRRTVSGDPITDINSSNMICGVNAQNAPASAKAKPGDEVAIFWNSEEQGTNWPHLLGPVTSYMTKCTGDCKDFTPTQSSKWFKVGELGQKSPGAKEWFQGDLHNGRSVPVTIPKDLSNGNYLMRHEIIGLHVLPAEFYPYCIQFTIEGGSDAAETPSPTVNFPGAYKAGDPGITADVFSPLQNYVMPGPAVVSFKAGGSGGFSSEEPSGSAAPSATSSGSSPPSSTISASSSSSSSAPTASSTPLCKKKKRTSGAQKRSLKVHKRASLNALRKAKEHYSPYLSIPTNA